MKIEEGTCYICGKYEGVLHEPAFMGNVGTEEPTKGFYVRMAIQRPRAGEVETGSYVGVCPSCLLIQLGKICKTLRQENLGDALIETTGEYKFLGY